jgi:hypothetical protein
MLWWSDTYVRAMDGVEMAGTHSYMRKVKGRGLWRGSPGICGLLRGSHTTWKAAWSVRGLCRSIVCTMNKHQLHTLWTTSRYSVRRPRLLDDMRHG